MSLGNGWAGQPGVHRMVIGKMLGGSQSHNAFKYSRGSQHDYNYYANVTGVRNYIHNSHTAVPNKLFLWNARMIHGHGTT